MKKEKPPCPYCKRTSQVKKNGTFRNKQRFYCNVCKKTFMLCSSPQASENKDKIVGLWLNSTHNLSQTARKFGISVYRLKKMIKNEYKDEIEEQLKSQCELLANEMTKMGETDKLRCLARRTVNFSTLKRQLQKEGKKQ